MLAQDPEAGADHVRAARAEDGSFAFVYTPTGRNVAVLMDRINGRSVKAHWYNPRDGLSTEIGTFSGSAVEVFSPPTRGRGNDWILVLDDAQRGFAQPGAKR